MAERRVWNSKVTNIFQRKLSKYASGFGADTQFTTSYAGWYITIGGEITLYVGTEKPEFEIGDSIRFTLEKATANAQT